MFKKISQSLALQFTVFVLLLLLLNGTVFIITDYGNEKRQMYARLDHQMELIQNAIPDILIGKTNDLFIPHIERLRVMDINETTVFSGDLYEDVFFEPGNGFSRAVIGNEKFMLLTSPIIENDEIVGYIQIAEPEHTPLEAMTPKIVLTIVISLLISLLTFMIGKRFAKKSLQPAQDMLERLEQFTQDASHELRTPLAVLGSSLDLALKTKDYGKGIESAKEDLKQISELVERLLEIANVGHLALEKKSIDVSELLKKAALRFKPLADASAVTLHKDIAEGIRVESDLTLLNQIVWNLLSNAIKFSRSGGSIFIKLSQQSISITDEGIGIAKSDLPHIFERFYQVDRSRTKSGYGLGLSFVKKIIEMHEWNIRVTSEKNKGTTFEVFFS